MPLHDLTLLSKVVEDRVAKTTLQSAVLLQQLYLAGRMKTKANTSIDWDVLVDDGGVAIEPVTVDGSNTAIGTVVPANLRLGRYRVKHQFMVNRVDIKEAAARSHMGDPDLFNPDDLASSSALLACWREVVQTLEYNVKYKGWGALKLSSQSE